MSNLNIIRWPEGVAKTLDVSEQMLQSRRADGDCPKLYAVSPRVLVTTESDLLEWIKGKEVDTGYKCRPATRKGRAA